MCNFCGQSAGILTAPSLDIRYSIAHHADFIKNVKEKQILNDTFVATDRAGWLAEMYFLSCGLKGVKTRFKN